MAKISRLNDGTLLQGGKYRIVRFLGASEFVCTYEAMLETFGQRVVIKEFFSERICSRDASGHIHIDIISHIESFEKFRYEFGYVAQTLFQCKNLKGVAKVTDEFEENGTSYCVTDYIEGSSLREIVDANGPLSEAEALRIIRNVAQALEGLHAHKCLHLHIQPDNIILGSDRQPILIGFGPFIGNVIDDKFLAITSAYIPLEQIYGDERSFHPATDIYALGATLYTLITGLTPPTAIDLIDESNSLQYPIQVSRMTRSAIEAAMKPNVRRRPKNVQAFLLLLPREGNGRRPTVLSFSSVYASSPNKSVEPMSNTPHLRDGTLLQGGKYRIVRFLGAGGFGCTYEAHFGLLDASVAIKEFFPEKMCNRDASGFITVPTDGNREVVGKMRRKFVEEARTLYKFKHISGIVKVADVFEEKGTAYFVMDFIDGKSVQNLIDSHGRLSEAEALHIIDSVGQALQAVHALGSLHLDIKPANIMIGVDGRPILIDFGVSKQFNEEEGCNTSTLMGYTPGYAPLEQMNSNVHTFSAATDVYALAATLYAMLAGKRPPKATDLLNDVETLRFPDDISPTTRSAIEAAMEPKVKHRPQSVSAFLALLPISQSTNSSAKLIT